MKRAIAIIVALTLSASCKAADGVPPLTGPVNDTAHLLSDAEKQTLTTLLLEEEKKTKHQVVVLTLPSLNGASIEDVAQKIFKAWKLGAAGKDDGVLIIFASQERMVRIEVGRGLEGALTDAQCKRIIHDEMGPSFKDGKFAEALTIGSRAVHQAIRGEYVPKSNPATEEGWKDWQIALAVIGVILLVIILCVIEYQCPGTLAAFLSGLGSSGGSGGSSSSSSGGGGGYSGGGGRSGGGGASGRV